MIEKELKPLLKGLKEEFNGNAPNVAYIIVQKRIDSRFAEEFKGQLRNPGSFLVVDSKVTKDNKFEFFTIA